MNIATHEDWFARFVRGYCQAQTEDCSPLELKIQHTTLVLEHARRILAAHFFAPPVARAIALAALYHDVGRFPQYARWKTFKDSQSVNHGLLGLKILKNCEPLAAEEKNIRSLVLAAVGLHNRFALSSRLSADLQCVTHAVRDADKCDIMRIMTAELNKTGPKDRAVVLHVKDDPALWTPKVVDDICAGRVASYADLHSVNDFRLLLGSWLHDLRFAESRKYIKQNSYVEQILAPLPADPPVQKAKAYLLEMLNGESR